LLSDYLLVGLGNPGKEYETTRHNFGFLAATHYAKSCGIKFVRSAKYQGLIGSGVIDGMKTYILLPLTYMNVSGVAVRAVVKDKEISLSNTLVLCDDFNLAFGDIRIRLKGSAGGHNGLASIIKELQSDDIPRLRLGIGAPRDKSETTDFVLSEFKGHEKKKLDEIVSRAVDCSKVFFKSGIKEAMDRFNKRGVI
jgi:PTH1 family peptidyl-tRNA hydrolase